MKPNFDERAGLNFFWFLLTYINFALESVLSNSRLSNFYFLLIVENYALENTLSK